MNILKTSSFAALIALSAVSLYAEEPMPTPPLTGVSFLNIAPDARGGALGDVGAATSPDINAQYWNPSKYAFADSRAGIGFTYTPWLSKLVSDIGLSNLTGYYKFDEIQSISGSFRYFSLGKIDITDETGNIINAANPNEFALDVAYARQLSTKYSMGITLRYTHSNLDVDEESSAGNAFSADVSGYFQTPVYLLNGQDAQFSWGFDVSNIGTKISYDNGNISNFIPTNLRLGASFLYPFNDYNKLALSLDLNKLLVPAPPMQRDGETEVDYQERMQNYRDMSPIKGIFKSFGDRSFSDEIKEINLGLGAEYSYNDQFFARMGYHYESEMMGNRRFFSFGAGVKLNIFQLDASYLVASQNNPLDQTFRISLAFDLGGIRGLMR